MLRVAPQCGFSLVLDDPSRFAQAAYSRQVLADQSGYVASTDTEKIGIASVELGAGRQTKEDVIDFAAGIRLYKKAGDAVQAGEPLATLYADDPARFDAAEQTFRQAYTFAAQPPQTPPLVLARVTQDGVERF